MGRQRAGSLAPASEQSRQWLDLSQVALIHDFSSHLSRVFSLTFILKQPKLSMPSLSSFIDGRVQNENILSFHSVLISTAETLKPCGPKDPDFIDEETHKAMKVTDVFESLILCLPGYVIPMFQTFQVKAPLPIKA